MKSYGLNTAHVDYAHAHNSGGDAPIAAAGPSAIAEIASAEQRLADLHGVIDSVTQVFSPALSPTPPDTPGRGDGQTLPASASDLVLRLRGLLHGIDAAVLKLHRVVSRVEL